MKKNLFFLLFFIIFFQQQTIFAQHTNFVGIPFATNFSPEEYEADPQNWAITQDQQGAIYVANTLGILRFDGVEWTKISLPNVISRSIVTNEQGVMYVGSQGDIGYLQANDLGNLDYHSLLDKIPEKDRNFADIWSTYSNPTGIYFFSAYKIFCLQNNHIQVIQAPKKFNFCFQVENTIYTQDDSLGLCQISNNELQATKNGSFFLGKQIRTMLPYKNGTILLATLKEGLFIYHPTTGEIQSFGTKIQKLLIDNLVFCGRKLDENLYAIGTFRAGLVLLDSNGELLQILNEEKGLRNNSIRQTFIDRNNGLWLALNNGIARVELHSPLSIFDKRTNLNGSINRIITYENKLLVGTSLGIFQPVETQVNQTKMVREFSQIPTFSDQCWNLQQINKDLFIASNQGTSIYNADTKIINYSNNAVFLHLPISLNNKKYVLAGLRNGIEIFEYNDEHWTLVGNLAGINGEIRTLVQDANGVIWAGTKVNGIYKITFQNDIQSTEIKNYVEKDGLPSNKQNKVFLTKTGVLIGTTKGFFVWNEQKKLFVESAKLQIPITLKNNHQEAWNLYEDAIGNIWVFSGRHKAVFIKQTDGTFRWDYSSLSRIPLETINNIFQHNHIIWIASSNALYAYNQDFSPSGKQGFYVLFRRIALIDTDSVIAGSYFQNLKPKLSFSNNSISFDFAATHFDNPQATQYQYQLEGYENSWSIWTHTPQKDYTNLWNGKYKLKIRAKNIYGIMSNEVNYEFVISPPWYRTNVAYFSYLLFTMLSIFLFIQYSTKKLARKNKKLEELVQLRTAEIQQQKEEIEAQRDNLVHLNEELDTQKQEVEQSYQNIQILNQIGIEITAMLNIEQIVLAIYDNVNKIMDAPILAAGIYNEQRNKLEFYGIDDNSKKMIYSSDSIDDSNKLSVWCYQNQRQIFINDVATETKNYVENVAAPIGNYANSLIYIPLLVRGKKSGVITVQSYQKNAYNNYQSTVFANLGTYISIALENANSYHTISSKSQQITDSIRYAETIQKAILPTTDELQKAFGNNYFIFYQAKDVVSGDFYWLSIKNEKTVFVATVDCTGHGVPGAFMSLIGATLLNQIVEQENVESPAKILSNLHSLVRTVLRQKEMANRDGMDLCLCKLEKNENNTILTYAGAKRPLYYVNLAQELIQIKTTHKSIGGGNKEQIDFEEVSQIIQPNEMLYLTTDGYTDQNNVHNEKLGSAQLQKIVKNMAALPMEMQYTQVKDEFYKHKTKEIQRDDVTIVGIKI
jgi:serine phosphatase RsbU (regulator of sigma subunit)